MEIVLVSLLFIILLAVPAQQSSLNGVYRINLSSSDKLYSVVAGSTSGMSSHQQERVLSDLAARLTPPDMLAIQQEGRRISLGSSRAARMTFLADGVARDSRTRDGQIVRVRFAVENESLVYTSSGRAQDTFSLVIEPIDNGKRLQVVRTITSDALAQPVVIKTIYDKISDVARWDLHGETPSAATSPRAETVAASNDGDAGRLRHALKEWIEATNRRDIDKQMTYYVPRLKAYYLTRNTSSSFVRQEKARVFATASLIDVRAQEPEIIFQNDGRIAVMRYRKKYRIENGRQSRRGEVLQELRWERVGDEWRIFSERDLKVL